MRVLLKLGVLAASVAAVALVVVVGCGFESKRAPAVGWEVVPIRFGTGWGYLLLADGRPHIRQPHIPVLAGERPFASREDALRVGAYVADRLRTGRSPTVTLDDLALLLPLLDVSQHHDVLQPASPPHGAHADSAAGDRLDGVRRGGRGRH